MGLSFRRPMLRLAIAGGAFVVVAACAATGGTPSVTVVEPDVELPPTTALQDRSADSAARAARGDG